MEPSELASLCPDVCVWNSLSRIHREGERAQENGVRVSGWRTCNADIGPATLGGARRAPGHALAPVILQPKQLLHLLPRHLDLHLSHLQAWEEKRDAIRGQV